jgi:hypothetical protein
VREVGVRSCWKIGAADANAAPVDAAVVATAAFARIMPCSVFLSRRKRLALYHALTFSEVRPGMSRAMLEYLFPNKPWSCCSFAFSSVLNSE